MCTLFCFADEGYFLRAFCSALNALMFIRYERLAQAEKNLNTPWSAQHQKSTSKNQKKVR